MTTPYQRNRRLRKDRTIAALLMGLGHPVPVDVEARLLEHGITLKHIHDEYELNNI